MRQVQFGQRFVGDTHAREDGAAVDPNVFRPSVLKERIEPRTAGDNGAGTLHMFYPRL